MYHSVSFHICLSHTEINDIFFRIGLDTWICFKYNVKLVKYQFQIWLHVFSFNLISIYPSTVTFQETLNSTAWFLKGVISKYKQFPTFLILWSTKRYVGRKNSFENKRGKINKLKGQHTGIFRNNNFATTSNFYLTDPPLQSY